MKESGSDGTMSENTTLATVQTARDLQRFVREVDGEQRLHVKLIPRPIYVAMVQAWRMQPDVITAVADEGFWLWDYNERSKQWAAKGIEFTPWDVAESILREMDDREWWLNQSRFEEHLIAHAPEDMDRWAELLAPAYDDQERDGWVLRQ